MPPNADQWVFAALCNWCDPFTNQTLCSKDKNTITLFYKGKKYAKVVVTAL